MKFVKYFFFREITGQTASYGFIHFDSDAAALMAMHKLNGKIIPHSQPVSEKIDTQCGNLDPFRPL